MSRYSYCQKRLCVTIFKTVREGDKVTCFTVSKVLKDIVRCQQSRLLEHTGKDNKYNIIEPESKTIHSLTSSQRAADNWKIGRRFT